MTKHDEKYLLGHDDEEWRRLAEQHGLWKPTLLDSLERLGVADGATILEVGCGSGVLLADLAALAGSTGRATGVELDEQAFAQARAKLGANADVHRDDVMSLELGQSFDLVVARWVLSFLPRPRLALERMLEHVRPGGLIVVQDYDYDGLRVTPGDPALDRLFEVMPEAYAQHGGDAWIATQLPRLYAELGIELVAVEPHCFAGPPSSPVFRWVETFFRQHTATLVEDGLLTTEEREQSLAAWTAVHEVPGTVLFSPLVVNVIGRRPPSDDLGT